MNQASKDTTKTEAIPDLATKLVRSVTTGVEDLTSSLLKPVVTTVDGLANIAKGMYTVVKHTTRDPITSAYPHRMPELYPRSRHRLALNVDPDTGEHLCIACKQCERVCPDSCITVVAHDSVKAKSTQFYIDHGLCMFCGLCTEVCPTDCIINTVDFEMSEETREDLIYDIRKLTLSQEQSREYFNLKNTKPNHKKKQINKQPLQLKQQLSRLQL
jgi:NADH-quinone oxidoreductase subunit I